MSESPARDPAASPPSGPSRDESSDPRLIERLRRRADLLHGVREFFRDRGYLEVETPALSEGVLVERHIHPLAVRTASSETLCLHTSPEAAMKRLLALGSGPIFQVARVFRDGEKGALHRREFTLLEWYRPGIDHHALMDEVGEFLTAVLGTPPPRRTSYREAFQDAVGIDPLAASVAELAAVVARQQIPLPAGLPRDDRDAWFELLLTFSVGPQLGAERPCFLHDYPSSQAAFARLRGEGTLAVAERFEAYYRGVELANGYHEIVDADEYERRMQLASEQRGGDGVLRFPLDEAFLRDLRRAGGLPPCSGVALGLDRLLMLSLGANSLDEVLPPEST